jgi:hypothetical protein
VPDTSDVPMREINGGREKKARDVVPLPRQEGSTRRSPPDSLRALGRRLSGANHDSPAFPQRKRVHVTVPFLDTVLFLDPPQSLIMLWPQAVHRCFPVISVREVAIPCNYLSDILTYLLVEFCGY